MKKSRARYWPEPRGRSITYYRAGGDLLWCVKQYDRVRGRLPKKVARRLWRFNRERLLVLMVRAAENVGQRAFLDPLGHQPYLAVIEVVRWILAERSRS